MTSAATYNRQALGRIWQVHDLPEAYPGCQILRRGGLDPDLDNASRELDGIDWTAFSALVEDFQVQQGLAPRDGKLGPATLRKIREFYGAAPASPDILIKLGPLEFRAAATPVSAPPGPPLRGRTTGERSLADLWNRYGAAIERQAQACGLPVASALAVFSVESGTAYDPRTGLVIIRFEPHIFRRQSGQGMSATRGGQQAEWQNLAQAWEVAPKAALKSTSWGLPQLMGFNWQVTRHPGVQAMVLAFQDSCEEQVAGFFDFVKGNGLVSLIRQGDWRGFTRRYNGPGNVPAYSAKLLRALQVIKNLQDDGACFMI